MPTKMLLNLLAIAAILFTNTAHAGTTCETKTDEGAVTQQEDVVVAEPPTEAVQREPASIEKPDIFIRHYNEDL